MVLIDNLGAGTSSLNALAFCKTLIDQFLESEQTNSVHIASSNDEIFQFYKEEEVRRIRLSSSEVSEKTSEPQF